MALKLTLAEREFVPEWNGNRKEPEEDQIKLDYRPLLMGDAFALQDKTGLALLTGFEINSADPEMIKKQWSMMAEVIAGYTSNWRNVIVDGKTLNTGQEVIDSVGLKAIDLISEVMAEVLASSTGSVEDLKNSESLSGPTNSESDASEDAQSE